MSGVCEICGATEKIQEHHISYDPEIKQFLCVSCHQKKHGHGVGTVGKAGISVVNDCKEEFTMLCEAEATNKEIAGIFGINKLTVRHWKEKLGFKGVGKRITKHPLKHRADTPKTPKKHRTKTRIAYLPARIIAALHLSEGDELEWKVEGNKAIAVKKEGGA